MLWTEEPGRLQSTVSHRVGYDQVTEHIFELFISGIIYDVLSCFWLLLPNIICEICLYYSQGCLKRHYVSEFLILSMLS